MAVLQWSDSLSLDLPLMDETHKEFVVLLGLVEGADDDQVLPAWRDLVEHTAQHFGREEDWMRSTGFSSTNCHTLQHRVVLQAMREGLDEGRIGHLALIRQMAHELAIWFMRHAQTMDAALALHLRGVGFDPVSGEVRMPQALPVAPLESCGSATCATAAH
jgi:hemerythrin-like metal-binding protein